MAPIMRWMKLQEDGSHPQKPAGRPGPGRKRKSTADSKSVTTENLSQKRQKRPLAETDVALDSLGPRSDN